MGYIYIIKNTVNDKVYIGQTQLDVEQRFKAHLRSAVKGTSKLYNAMRDLGIDNFYVESLEECEVNRLNERETHYIEIYNSVENGYNSTRGGEINRSSLYTVDELQEMADSGLSLTKLAKETGLTIGFLSHYVKTNAEANNNGDNEPIPIDMYDEDYNFLQTFNSMREAIRFFIDDKVKNKRNTYNSIKQSCYLGNTYHGYRFRYSGESFDGAFQIQEEKERLKQAKKEETFGKNSKLADEMYKLYMEGKSYKEIGDMYNKSPDSVRVFINRHSTLKSVKRMNFIVQALDKNSNVKYTFNTFKDAGEEICKLKGLTNSKNIGYKISKAVENETLYQGFIWKKVYGT